MNKSVPSSAKQQREIAHIYRFNEYLSIQPLIFSSACDFDSAQTNPVAGFFVNTVKCEQDGIIAK